MATLNVIYKIAADISGLQDGVNRAASSVERIESSAMTAGRALAGMVSVSALVGFANTILDAADNIQKMADQTGMATEEVQRLQYISGQTSTSVESLVSAAQNLQQRLGEGNAGTVGAIAKLNINLEAFTKLGAYEQMTSLAEKVRAIKDPTDQAATAAAIFGKNWKEILPAIKAGMKEVGDQATVMSDQTIKALDRIGDTLTKAKGIATAWGGSVVLAFEGAGYALGQFLSAFDPSHFGVTNDQLLKMMGELNDKDGLQGALKNAQNAASKLTSDGIAPLGKVVAPTGAALAEMNMQLDFQRDAMNKASAAAKAEAEALKHLQAVVNALNRENAQGLVPAQGYDPSKGEIPGLAKLRADVASNPFVGLNLELGKTGAIVNALTSTSLPQLSLGLVGAASAAANLASGALTLGQTIKNNLTSVLQSVPQTLVNAFTGGGNLLGAAQAIGSQLGSAIGDGIGKTISTLGKLGGPIGAAIGSLAGPLIGLIGKLFDNPEKQINPVREAFVQAAGGLAQLNQHAHEAGVTLDHLLDAKTPEAYKRAIDELNAAFSRLDKLKAGASQFGMGHDELVQAEKDAHDVYDYMEKSGQYTQEQIGAAYYAWQKAMADAGNEAAKLWIQMHDGVVGGAGAVSGALDALKAQRDGLAASIANEAPEQVMGVIESQTRGQMAVLDDQIAKTSLDLKNQAQEAADDLKDKLGNIEPDAVHVGVVWDIPPFPDAHLTDNVPAMADGGIVNRPTIALIGEAGPEAVVPLGRDGGVGGSVTIENINVQVSEGDDPRKVADKIIDALRTQAPLYDAIRSVRAA